MVSRQQASEAAAVAAALPSTLPAREGRPLAKQNGEGDDSSIASGILQRLWTEILGLATGVAESGLAQGKVVGASSPATPRTPGRSPEQEASTMRLKALELIEVWVWPG